MLYNYELIKKLRIGAFSLSAFIAGYAMLTYLDHNITVMRLCIVFALLLVSAVATFLLRKPGKIEFAAYVISMLLIIGLLLFRVIDNIALDISLAGMAIGLAISFGLQLRKDNEYA
jgi:hypothetical protein